jgi:hypothetical protein
MPFLANENLAGFSAWSPPDTTDSDDFPSQMIFQVTGTTASEIHNVALQHLRRSKNWLISMHAESSPKT